jgi:hypothetical protein
MIYSSSDMKISDDDHDKVGLLQKAKKARWNKLFLKSSKKAGSLGRQLEPCGLDTMPKQYIASYILKG